MGRSRGSNPRRLHEADRRHWVIAQTKTPAPATRPADVVRARGPQPGALSCRISASGSASTRRRSRRPIPGASQVPNSAGGFSLAVDDWTRLDRFLILGIGGRYVLRHRAQADARQRRGRPALHRSRWPPRRRAHRRDLGGGPRAQERPGPVRAGRWPQSWATSRPARARVRRATARGAHRYAPVPFRRVREGAGRLGPGHVRAVRALVHRHGRQPPRAPGGQVPEPRRLVAPRPAAQGAPEGDGRRAAPGHLPLDGPGLGLGGRRRRTPTRVLAPIWAFERAKRLRDEARTWRSCCELVRRVRPAARVRARPR